ncbi:hypothetical protein POM88_048649 [Heracleum sosnowskyi]|uniref:DUF674 family protein n=1 Tax=Heracleum sosnowskyi TaxID=360622 RepID=A0AAD8GWN3_9APIA|nr:hypothetical protein POM88_048649 [Heracleum sosnowskyi]
MGEINSGKIKLKLLVDRNTNRVILAEAGKEFVDFLFHILTLPLGTVVKLLSSKNNVVGSLGKIYESVEAMNVATCMESDAYKEQLLNPMVYSNLGDTPFFLGNKSTADSVHATENFYKCSKDTCTKIAGYPNGFCGCDGRYRQFTQKLTYIQSPASDQAAAKSGKGGYVKREVNYMVMDNLVVKPILSTISCIPLYSNLKDMSALETLEVYIGKNEAADLLKASFVTAEVLTSLFLKKPETKPLSTNGS